MNKFRYKHLKLIVLLFGLVGVIIGTAISAFTVRNEAEAVDFIINPDTVKKYGYFDDIGETSITGTILKPIGEDLDKDAEKPCIFVFHGMFMDRFLQMQTAMYFAKQGWYVVLLDHSGQGESMGRYRLGYELEAIGKTVVDYFIEEGFEKYDMKVDLDKLGCNGHSYGGVTSTFTGINMQEKIKAVAAIWSWSELPQTVADIMIGVGTDPKDMFDTNLYRFLTKMTGFGDSLYYDREGDYSTDPEDVLDTLEDRNVIDRVNYSQKLPPNFLLITGEEDELTTPGQQINLMAMASWNASGGISFDDWKEEVEKQVEDTEEWSNLEDYNSSYSGNFDEKTARSIFLPKNTKPFSHMMEGFLVSTYVRIIEWFGKAFDVDVDDIVTELEENGIETGSLSFLDGPLPAYASLKMISWFLALMALIIALPAIISYLVRIFRFENDEEQYQAFINEYDDFSNRRYEGLELKLIGIAIVIYMVAEFLSLILPMTIGLTPKVIGIPYIITDALILIMIGRYLIVVPSILLLFYLLVRKIKKPISLEKVGLIFEKKEILKDIALGLTIALIFFIGFNLIGLISLSPRLLPRKSPTLGYWGYIFLLLYFLIFFFFDELSFRGIIQTKAHDFVYTKMKKWPNYMKKWTEFIMACGFQIIILLFGTFLGLIIILEGIPPVLVSAFLIGGISASFIPAFLSTYIYQRTRRIIPCIVSSAFILTMLLGGSFIGAIMF